MALLFCDSCGDHYGTSDIPMKWSANVGNGASVTASGRTGNGITGISSVRKNLRADTSTLIIGWAVKWSALPIATTQVLDLYDYTSVGTRGGYQIELRVESSGSIGVYRGDGSTSAGVTLAQSAPGIIRSGTFQYYEFKVVFSTTTTGSVEIRVDEVSVASASSVQTARTNAFASIVEFQILSSSPQITIDDVYCCDGTGGVHDNFLGDNQVLCLFPSADGRVDQWSFTGAANAYQTVNEHTPDRDTSYVYDQTAGHVEVFAMDDLPGTVQNVTALQTVLLSRIDAVGGSRGIASVIGDGASEVISSDTRYPGNDYSYWIEPYDQDPVSAAAWTVAKVNAMQAGVKEIS